MAKRPSLTAHREPLPRGLTLVRKLGTSPLPAARTREVESSRARFLSLCPHPLPRFAPEQSRRAPWPVPPPSTEPPPAAFLPPLLAPVALWSRRRHWPSTELPQTPRANPCGPAVLSPPLPSQVSALPSDRCCSLVQLFQCCHRMHLTLAYFTTVVWV